LQQSGLQDSRWPGIRNPYRLRRTTPTVPPDISSGQDSHRCRRNAFGAFSVPHTRRGAPGRTAPIHRLSSFRSTASGFYYRVLLNNITARTILDGVNVSKELVDERSFKPILSASSRTPFSSPPDDVAAARTTHQTIHAASDDTPQLGASASG